MGKLTGSLSGLGKLGKLIMRESDDPKLAQGVGIYKGSPLPPFTKSDGTTLSPAHFSQGQKQLDLIAREAEAAKKKPQWASKEIDFVEGSKAKTTVAEDIIKKERIRYNEELEKLSKETGIPLQILKDKARRGALPNFMGRTVDSQDIRDIRKYVPDDNKLKKAFLKKPVERYNEETLEQIKEWGITPKQMGQRAADRGVLEGRTSYINDFVKRFKAGTAPEEEVLHFSKPMYEQSESALNVSAKAFSKGKTEKEVGKHFGNQLSTKINSKKIDLQSPDWPHLSKKGQQWIMEDVQKGIGHPGGFKTTVPDWLQAEITDIKANREINTLKKFIPDLGD